MVSYYVIIESSVLHPRSDSRNWPRSSECFISSGYRYLFTGYSITLHRYKLSLLLENFNSRKACPEETRKLIRTSLSPLSIFAQRSNCSAVAVLGYQQPHDKTNKMTQCAPSEASDQPGHPPCLIRVFIVRSMGS